MRREAGGAGGAGEGGKGAYDTRKSQILLAHPDTRLPFLLSVREGGGAQSADNIHKGRRFSLLAVSERSKGCREAAPTRSSVHLCPL